MRKIILLAIILMPVFLLAQAEEKHVENPDVPQLKEMHHYIYQMWHKGYPEKDIALLKTLYPDLQEQYQNLENVEFPEKWQDRQMHWNEGLSQMKNSLDSYQMAMESGDEEALLDATRKLHDDFERLVRIVNPPIPEIDDFHKTLYHVYHDYLPEKKWDKLRESIDEFSTKMAAIEKVSLPKWMSENEAKFDEARKNLSEAVDRLVKLKDSEDTGKLETAVEELHSAYVNLEASME